MSGSPVHEDLRAQAVRGMKWIGAATFLVFVLNLGQNVVLGRILGPRDFGLVGMIWVVLGLAQLFADSGLSNLLIQRQDLSRRQTTSVFWLNFLLSLSLAALCWASAPLLVNYYQEPLLLRLTPWAALSFAFASLGMPFRALAQKELRYPRLALADLLAAAAGFVAAVSLAMQGYGVYALLYSSVLNSFLKTLLLALTPGRASLLEPHFSLQEIRPLLNPGALQVGERLCNYVWSNVDYLLIGRFLGSTPLGLYRMAYEIAIRPLALINPVFNSVAYPLFARRQQDGEALRRGYLELLELLSAIVLPLMAGLALLAPQVILLLFGPAWEGAAPVLQILCLLGALRALQNPVGNLILSKGLFGLGFRTNFTMMVLSIVVYLLVLPRFGLLGLAWSSIAILLAVMAFYWRDFYGNTAGIRFRDWLSALRVSLLASALMLSGLFWLPAAGFLPPWADLFSRVLLGAFLYIATYSLLAPATTRRLVSLLLRRGG
jgi:O-antigen/teichoic acid export membrane protein